MSNIEWTEETWNPLTGCTPVSKGCLNCYAARMAIRLEAMGTLGYEPVPERPEQDDSANLRIAEVRAGRPVFTGSLRLVEERLAQPFGWKKPRRVFVNSMSDLFHPDVPFDFIDKVFAVMALCPQHTFQILTKRPERMLEYLDSPHRRNIPVYDAAAALIEGEWDRMPPEMRHTRSSGPWWPLPNVWLGTSVESNEHRDRAWALLKCPAAKRFLSCEPLLGPVDLDEYELLCKDWSRGNPTIGTYLDWVIAGGESGPGARDCDVAWIRSIVEQCKASEVPVFVKQLGKLPSVRIETTVCGKTYSDFYNRWCGFWPPEARDEDAWVLRIKDIKGGNPDEWPEDLRVREMPEVKG